MKINIKVKPNSKQELIDVVYIKDPILISIKTKKPAADGLANKDIIRILSKFLNCTKSSVSIVKGLTSSHKIIDIPFTKEELIAILNKHENFLL